MRSLRGREEREAAVALYRRTFGLSDSDPAMAPKLVAALQHNGGSAVGAFTAAGELVGFAYGFVGVGDGAVYHYSQAAVVAPSQQGRGIGRSLKFAQAELAARSGVRTMRWAYDPLLARNAHFNLDVLGARGRWFHRDYYDYTDSGGRSDRVVVEWDLDAALKSADTPRERGSADVSDSATADVGDLAWGGRRETETGALVVIPADWEALVRADTDRAAEVRDLVAAQLEELLARGWVLGGCSRIDDSRAVYRVDARTGELAPDAAP